MVTYVGDTFKTDTKFKTLNPEWNMKFPFVLDERFVNSEKKTVNFRVMDKDRFGGDDFEGDVVVDATQLPNVDNQPITLPLNNVTHGTITVSFHVKMCSKTPIRKLNLPKSIIDTESLFRATRNSWLTGVVKYPMSRYEINAELERLGQVSQNLSEKSPRGSSSGNSFSFCIPKWREDRVNDHLIVLRTDVEEIFGYNPSVVDFVRAELIVGEEEASSPRDLFENHVKSIVNNCDFSKATWSEVKLTHHKFHTVSFSGELDISERVTKETANYPDVLKRQYQSTCQVHCKTHVVALGGNTCFAYTYVSNCGSPYWSSMEELADHSTPPVACNLFENLFCDVSDCLWIKCPFGWEFKKSERVEESSHLTSPIHGKKQQVDCFELKKLSGSNSIVELAKLQLEHVESKPQFKMVKAVTSTERTVNDKKKKPFAEFEVQYKDGENTISQFTVVTETSVGNIWMISYETSTQKAVNRDVFDMVLGTIKHDENVKH